MGKFNENGKRPIIGVMPLYDEEKESYWMLPGYMEALEKSGAAPLMLPLTECKETLIRLLDMSDGLLFTGGHDVHPSEYGVIISEKCGETCDRRDAMELYLLSEAEKRDMPAFGICRGLQLMNVFFGGTLYQDIPEEYPSCTEHHMEPPYHVPAHEVTLVTDTPLAGLLEKTKIKVNSYHHQAVKGLSDRMLPMAISEDGLVEAAYVPGKKMIAGVQWHPEFSYLSDEDSLQIFRWFVGKCKC